MKLKTELKLANVEVKQSERGVISFVYDKPTDAMLDLLECIAELEERLAGLDFDNPSNFVADVFRAGYDAQKAAESNGSSLY